MAALHQWVTIAAPIHDVYAVIADVERYPEFIPDVKRVRRKGDLIEMTAQVGPLELVWVHRATFIEDRAVEIRLVRGPFKQYDAEWTLRPVEGGTEVRYDMRYELDLKIPGASGFVNSALKNTMSTTLNAFKNRIRRRASTPPPADQPADPAATDR